MYFNVYPRWRFRGFDGPQVTIAFNKSWSSIESSMTGDWGAAPPKRFGGTPRKSFAHQVPSQQVIDGCPVMPWL